MFVKGRTYRKSLGLREDPSEGLLIPEDQTKGLVEDRRNIFPGGGRETVVNKRSREVPKVGPTWVLPGARDGDDSKESQ